MVTHVLRPAVVHRDAADTAPDPADPTPPHPPRVSPRLLLLYHHRVVQLFPRGRPLLASDRVAHREGDRRAAAGRRHEVGAEDGGDGLRRRRHLVR